MDSDVKILYSANNSGGVDWLDDKDWQALEDGGWVIDKEFLIGGRYHDAEKDFPVENEDDAIELAKRDFNRLTGQWADDEGCPCCGPPHNFYRTWYGD